MKLLEIINSLAISYRFVLYKTAKEFLISSSLNSLVIF